MGYLEEAEALVAMWRQVKRDLEAADPLSDEASRLINEWAHLRGDYQRLVEAARLDHRPEPPPWPEEDEPPDSETTGYRA